MVKNTEQALEDLSDLKDSVRVQNDAMKESIMQVNTSLVNESTEIRGKMSELWNFMVKLK